MNKRQIIVSIFSVLIMLVMCLLYAMRVRVNATADLIAITDLQIADIKNIDSIYNTKLVVDFILFIIAQIIALAMYLFRNKKGLIALLIIEVIILVIGLFIPNIEIKQEYLANISAFDAFCVMPIINIIIYLLCFKDKKEN